MKVMEKMLPRHAEIIKRIDAEWSEKLVEKYGYMKVRYRQVYPSC